MIKNLFMKTLALLSFIVFSNGIIGSEVERERERELDIKQLPYQHVIAIQEKDFLF
ncbi:TPA: hypothetical protein ACGXKN_005137 [Bacillus cereus]